ncbi:MAG: hypothetical protein Q8K46_06565, partial [Deltaproteobacteria bacterium]|nr:hypothetical protein [Deltaproteobacteria bacterium]
MTEATATPPSNPPAPADPKPATKLRERVENHPVVFFLGVLLAGFTAGLATYQGALKLIDYTTVPASEYKRLQADAAAPPQPTQRWLRLTGLEGLDGSNARVVLRINGRAISYPSRTVWTQARANLPVEEFALPFSTSPYEISFEILTVDSATSAYREYKSQEVVSVSQFPYSSTYRIFAIAAGPAG